MPDKAVLYQVCKNNKVHFATTGFLFDQPIADSLRDNGSYIDISLDSGTRETFKLVKGADCFDVVIDNLKQYRNHGEVQIKYIIIPGINDGDSDIEGIIDILQMLRIEELDMSFEGHIPLRASFYPLTRFVSKLYQRGLTFRFHGGYYTVSQIEEAIEKHCCGEWEKRYIARNNQYREAYRGTYANDYSAYKKYIHDTEVADLLENFPPGHKSAFAENPKYNSIIRQYFFSLEPAEVFAARIIADMEAPS
jgi:hypothetical protein